MSAFTENPFFFFVDNAQPIFPGNICNDARKIVEVTDVGCDARPPSPAFQRYADRHYRNYAYGVAPNAEKWRWHREEPYYPTNNISGGKFEEYKRHNVRNVQGIRSVPTKSGSNYSRYWQKQPSYQDYMSYEKVRKPINREFNVNREESIKKRSRMHNYDRKEQFGNIKQNPAEFCYNASNRYFENKRNVLRNDYPFELVEETLYVNEYSNLDTIDTENDCRDLAGQNLTPREPFVEESYPETFENNLRNYSRSRRDRWQKYDTRNEKQLEQPYSRYNPKFSKLSNECDVSTDAKATIDNRIRSRTRSPPQDRQKRTKSFTKSIYNSEDLKNTDSAYKNSKNIEDKVDKVSPSLTRQNIDAPNSADSMRNLFEYTADSEHFASFSKISSTSITHCISAANVSTADVPTLRNEQRNAFWEFIPLDNEVEKKCTKVMEKLESTVHSSDHNRPIKSTVLKNEDYNSKAKRSNKIREASNNAQNCFIPSVKKNMEKWKDRLNVNSACNSPLSKRPKACSATDDKMHRISARRERPFSAAPVLQKVQNPQKLTSNNRKISSTKNTNSINLSQNSTTNLTSIVHSSRIHIHPENGKSQNQLDSDSVDKLNQSKRINSAVSSNVDKKKIVENIITAGDKKRKMSFVEKTAARLKRRLEITKPGIGGILNEGGTEKKFQSDGSVCSKLPVRIGNRLRSKEPMSLNNRNLKADVFEKGNKDCLRSSENSNQGNSERSRTKPKIRSSLRQNENLKNGVSNSKDDQGN